jgi:hypothetical protein
VVHALTAVLGSLHDIVAPTGQVQHIHAFDFYLPFVCL